MSEAIPGLSVPEFVEMAVDFLGAVMAYAIPAGIALGLCGIICNMFFAAVFSGRVKVGGGH